MARPKKPTDELKDQRVPIMMSEDELKAIDDWSFNNRIRSRGEAIRRLCQIGLEFEASSDSMMEELMRASKRLSETSDDFQKAKVSAPLALYLAGQDVTIAGMDSIVSLVSIFGPLYVQTLPQRAMGDFAEILEAVSEFKKHFAEIKGDKAETIKQVSKILGTMSRGRKSDGSETEST